jgi:GH18 family chitinase
MPHLCPVIDYSQHLYYSFAFINSANSTITTRNSWDEENYIKFNRLKERKPSLKTYITVGGWDAGRETFSAIVCFPGTRRAFIQSSLEFMENYGFNSINIDWEYPVSLDRGEKLTRQGALSNLHERAKGGVRRQIWSHNHAPGVVLYVFCVYTWLGCRC